MKFRIRIRTPEANSPERRLQVNAEDWFSAFRKGLEILDEELIQDITFTLAEDDLSAEVTDKQTGRVFQVDAIQEELTPISLEFEVYIHHPNEHEEDETAQIIAVRAGDWFSALQLASAELPSPIDMQELNFSLQDDGASATVIDNKYKRIFNVQAILPKTGSYQEFDDPIPLEKLAEQEFGRPAPKLFRSDNAKFIINSLGHARRYWWVLLLVGLLIGGGVFAGLELLSFPLHIRLMFGVLLGLEGAFLTWVLLSTKIESFFTLAKVQWQHDNLRRKASLLLSLCFGTMAIYLGTVFSTRLSLWWQTLILLISFVFLLYGGSTLITSWLLRAEANNRLNHGTTRHMISWVISMAVLSLFIVLVGLGDFVGGMNWWYYNYVTEERRDEVNKRISELKSLQLKTLYDNEKKYLGLYSKTESDWSRYYNDPKLLEWKISQAITLSEGGVSQPSWWWRYLPDGDKLLSEPFSMEGFLRVPYYFVKQRRKVGGSTPTLQLAKILMDYGARRQGKSFLRTIGIKLFEEIPRAYVMSQNFTPREMLATYMATLWAGFGANYGLHRMSLYYFGTNNPSKLDWNQAIVLASSLPNPGTFNPWYTPRCLRRCPRRCKKKDDPATCENQCKARCNKVQEIWHERIRQLKRRIRRMGHKIPRGLPTFRRDLSKLRAISRSFYKHDLHIRSWIRDELPKVLKDWNNSSSITLHYNRRLTLGKNTTRYIRAHKKHAPKPRPLAQTPKPAAPSTTPPTSRPSTSTQPPTPRTTLKKLTHHEDGLVDFIQRRLEEYRKQLKNIQITYTIYDANTGGIVSQYGGDKHFDLAHSRKPTVGSTFKILTMLISAYWPDRLPLINQGRDKKKLKKKRRFVYQPLTEGAGHWVKNNHIMARYVTKMTAIRLSANIAFVFLSLRWTWFLDEDKWSEVMRVGLAQMYQDKFNLSNTDANTRAIELMQDPQKLKRELIQHFGYERYLRGLRKKAVFEAAKASTVLALLNKGKVYPGTLTRFLDSEDMKGFPKSVMSTFFGYRWMYWQRFEKQKDSLEEISWLRPFRMELGLRYIIHLSKMVANFQPKKDFLKPVLTMTLGVNNARTNQLAAMAGIGAVMRAVRPRFIRSIERGEKVRYSADANPIQLPIPEKSLRDIRRGMQAVLSWGTAAKAGTLLAKRYGYSVLKSSGAKTGTVQNNRGVSCIGYLENRAGALTISTPYNKRLETFTLRERYTKLLDYYKTRKEHWEQKLEQAIPETRQARWYADRLSWFTKKYEEQKEKVDKHEERAKLFLKMGKVWRRSERKANAIRGRAKHLWSKAMYDRSQSRVYRNYARGDMRMINVYNKWFKRFEERAQRWVDKARNKHKTMLDAENKKREELKTPQEHLEQAKKNMDAADKVVQFAKKEWDDAQALAQKTQDKMIADAKKRAKLAQQAILTAKANIQVSQQNITVSKRKIKQGQSQYQRAERMIQSSQKAIKDAKQLAQRLEQKIEEVKSYAANTNPKIEEAKQQAQQARDNLETVKQQAQQIIKGVEIAKQHAQSIRQKSEEFKLAQAKAETLSKQMSAAFAQEQTHWEREPVAQSEVLVALDPLLARYSKIRKACVSVRKAWRRYILALRSKQTTQIQASKQHYKYTKNQLEIAKQKALLWSQERIKTLKKRADEAEQYANNLDRRAKAADPKSERAQRQIQEAQKQATNAQKRIQEIRVKAKNSGSYIRKYKQQLVQARKSILSLEQNHKQVLAKAVEIKKPITLAQKAILDSTLIIQNSRQTITQSNQIIQQSRNIKIYRNIKNHPISKSKAPQMVAAWKDFVAKRRLHRAAKAKLVAAQRRVAWAHSRTVAAQNHLNKALAHQTNKTAQYHKYVKYLKRNKERYAMWTKRAAEADKRSQENLQRYTEALQESAKWLEQARKEEIEYKKTRDQVYYTHKHWIVSSSQACVLLFSLLGKWKDTDEGVNRPFLTAEQSALPVRPRKRRRYRRRKRRYRKKAAPPSNTTTTNTPAPPTPRPATP